jgi:hypothetical protein
MFHRLRTLRRLPFGAILFALALASLPAVAAVRQTSGLLNQGTRWETPYYVQQSDQAGPTVVIVGGVHGDEPAGAMAADELRCWPIQCGTLAVLPRANPPALAAHTRTIPDVEADLNNLNRNYPKADQPADQSSAAAGEPAQAIWTWVRALKPTWLLDLHEGTGIHGAGAKSVGSSAIVCPSPEADAAARRMLRAVNATIDNPKKPFVRLGPPTDGSLARAAGAHLGACAMTLETSIHDLPPTEAKPADVKTPQSKRTQPKTSQSKTAQSKTAQSEATGVSSSKSEDPSPLKIKEQPLSQRVRQHRIMVHCLLEQLGMIDAALSVDQLTRVEQSTGRATTLEQTCVALYDAGGSGGKGPVALDRILGEAGMQVLRVGPEEIAADGTLPHFQLLIVPGGLASKEAAAIGEAGRQRIQQFVRQGGGYMGICAGAYLGTSTYDWSLKVVNAKTVSPHWQRGIGTVKIELAPAGRQILGDRPGLLDVHYANGPILTRADVATLPDYEVLVFFRSELAKHGTPVGVMTDSPAMVAGHCGQGRAVLISPHPEQTPGLEDLVRQAARWAAGRQQ